ncbi:MAG: hypothetical protein M1829_006773 [Trizodia sp. TS-e1964]|nr:MAG: hypothetical protein M1829_006773 [Trizodia sp. TS-e1964]
MFGSKRAKSTGGPAPYEIPGLPLGEIPMDSLFRPACPRASSTPSPRQHPRPPSPYPGLRTPTSGSSSSHMRAHSHGSIGRPALARDLTSLSLCIDPEEYEEAGTVRSPSGTVLSRPPPLGEDRPLSLRERQEKVRSKLRNTFSSFSLGRLLGGAPVVPEEEDDGVGEDGRRGRASAPFKLKEKGRFKRWLRDHGCCCC